jgi:hypothetical protein
MTVGNWYETVQHSELVAASAARRMAPKSTVFALICLMPPPEPIA